MAFLLYLIELNLRGCRDLESTAFWHLGKLCKIERLVLDGTQIELPTLLVSLQSMDSLTHLSIGNSLDLISQSAVQLFQFLVCTASCQNLALSGSLDEIVRWLHRHKTKILSLDMWRGGHLSNQGMDMLVALTHLRELDIGWW